MTKKPLSTGLQLLQMMAERKYHNATIECARGLFLLSEDRKAFAREMIDFIEAGRSEKEFWEHLQKKAKQI